MEYEKVLLFRAPTLEEDMINASLNTGNWQYTDTPHFVVRGVFSPETTRCDLAQLIRSKTASIVIEDQDAPLFDAMKPYRRFATCVTDFEVREYMVGKGPDTLSLKTDRSIGVWGSSDLGDLSYEDAKAKLLRTGIIEHLAGKFEGFEYIVWIAPARNVAVKAWDIVHLWDVRGGGMHVRAVHRVIDQYKNTPENRAVLVYELDDYRREVKAAHAKLTELHDGRIGNNERLSLLLTDANEEFFEEHINGEGAYDYPDVLTPYPLELPSDE